MSFFRSLFLKTFLPVLIEPKKQNMIDSFCDLQVSKFKILISYIKSIYFTQKN